MPSIMTLQRIASTLGVEVREFFAAEAGDSEKAQALDDLLTELGRRNVVSLMVESGGTLQGALFDAGLVDKVYAFIAPIIIGGSRASSPVQGRGASMMAETWRLERTTLQQIGADWLVVGYPEKAG